MPTDGQADNSDMYEEMREPRSTLLREVSRSKKTATPGSRDRKKVVIVRS